MSESPHILTSPDAVLTTLGADGRRKWVYPTYSPGRFATGRRMVGWLLILTYLLLPVVPVAGRPAVLLDVLHREFALFGLVFYPTDTLLLMAFLIGVISLVVLGTALLGRVWCGWGCPQTVYLEFVFRPIERWLEGREHIRLRRDAGPWTLDKTWRKAAKFLLFLAISALLAHTFVAYFVGWQSLLTWMTGPPGDHWGFFLVMAVTTGLVLFDFGYFREQMCTIACPYARMQSVLLDSDSLIVSYNPTRGEPRARRSRAMLQDEAQGQLPALGDCIDCGACVRTCPTGIDIRDGLQMECIACTQCIDACDAIMARIERPRGLISYTSERALEGGSTRIVRPRSVLYATLLVVALGAFGFTLALRSSFDVNIGRVAGDPYVVLPDGRVANRLRFRVRNQSGTASSFHISTISPSGLELRPVGSMPVFLENGAMNRLEVWVVSPADILAGGAVEARFQLTFGDESSRQEAFVLLGPNQ